MVNLSDRQRMRKELVAVGFVWESIDSGQPRQLCIAMLRVWISMGTRSSRLALL